MSNQERSEQPFNDLSARIYSHNREVGWWDSTPEGEIPTMEITATKLCLIHSEISEALEGARKNLMDDHLPHRRMVEVELADAIIRILDLAGALQCDLDGALREKMEYNNHREDHKREVRQRQNGKSL